MKKHKKNLTEFEEVVARQIAELPSGYVKSLFSKTTKQTVSAKLADLRISKNKTANISEDIHLLLLGLDSYDDFTDILKETHSLSEEKSREIYEFVNTNLYNQITGQMEKLQLDKKTSPIPPPPAPPSTPQAGYGGTSDPYKEPTGE